MSILLTQS